MMKNPGKLCIPPKANIGILLECFLTTAIYKNFDKVFFFFLSYKEKMTPSFMVAENGI